MTQGSRKQVDIACFTREKLNPRSLSLTHTVSPLSDFYSFSVQNLKWDSQLKMQGVIHFSSETPADLIAHFDMLKQQGKRAALADVEREICMQECALSAAHHSDAIGLGGLEKLGS